MHPSPTSSPVAPSADHRPAPGPALVPHGRKLLFALTTTLFFLWGIPNNLNDVLIRQFMKSFVLTRLEAGLVQFAFYLGYFVLAIPAALLMRRFGYKSGFLVGLALFSLGSFLFWPAAHVYRFSLFLTALFIIAAGLSFLETAANPFVAQLGPPESAARRLNLAQAFNPLGAISGVLGGTIFIFSGIELTPTQTAILQARHAYSAYLHAETLRVVRPYLLLSLVTLVMLLLFAVTRFPAIALESRPDSHLETPMASRHPGEPTSLLRAPHFLLAVAAQFTYVGAQVGTWSYLIPYLIEYTRLPEKSAGYLLTASLVAFGIGRFASAWLMRFLQPMRLMTLYSSVNLVLATLSVLYPGWLGAIALLLSSFFMSLMFPTIFARGLRGLGTLTKLAGSALVMSIVGGAVLTLGMGLISQHTPALAPAYLVPCAAYLFLLVYCLLDQRILVPESGSTPSISTH